MIASEGNSTDGGRARSALLAPHVGQDVVLNPIGFDFGFKAVSLLIVVTIASSSWETQGNKIKPLSRNRGL